MIGLYNCDCMDYMRSVPDKAFDLAVVDPPYFCGPNKLGYYSARKSKTGVFRDAYAKIGKWDLPNTEYFHELFRIAKEQIIWGINYFGGCVEKIGSGRIVWDKCNDQSSFSDCEIAYCSNLNHVKIFRYMWNGMLQGKSVTEGTTMQGNKRLNERRIHPTQKPVALYRWIYEKFATPGNRIFDSHLGSMSSVVAAADCGLDITGCEIDKQYFTAGLERVKHHLSQGDLFQNAPELAVNDLPFKEYAL